MIRSGLPRALRVFSRRWWSRKRMAFAAVAVLTAASATVFAVWAFAPLDVSKKGPGPRGTDPLAVHLRELQDSLVP